MTKLIEDAKSQLSQLLLKNNKKISNLNHMDCGDGKLYHFADTKKVIYKSSFSLNFHKIR